MKWPILFALLTGLCWGAYGPALAVSRTGLSSPFKPYVMIGIAYVVWGVLGGLLGMYYKGDSFNFTGSGVTWGFIAGSLGAFGALALTLAMFTGGGAMPQIVMPIVFGSAVTVAALFGAAQQRELSPGLILGILVIAIGIVLTASNTPHAHPAKKAVAQAH